MDLLTLLDKIKEVVGHNYVRWASEDGEIVIYTGLTGRNEDGSMNYTGGRLNLNPTPAAVAFNEMGD